MDFQRKYVPESEGFTQTERERRREKETGQAKMKVMTEINCVEKVSLLKQINCWCLLLWFPLDGDEEVFYASKRKAISFRLYAFGWNSSPV